MITYKDRVTPVQPGDRVETRIWFRKHRGRVVHVPGVSPFNSAEGVVELEAGEDRHGEDSLGASF